MAVGIGPCEEDVPVMEVALESPEGVLVMVPMPLVDVELVPVPVGAAVELIVDTALANTIWVA